MGDKSLPYDVLKKVMATCTDARLRQDFARRDPEGEARARRASSRLKGRAPCC